MSSRFTRLIVFLGLYAFVTTASATASGAIARMHVFIVGVGDFDESGTYPHLDVKDRIQDLEAMFRKSYRLGPNQIKIYSSETRSDTEQALAHLTADIRLASIAPNSIVFVFVLSHGVSVTGPPRGHDLVIVASNTPKEPKSFDSGRMLGSDVLQALATIGPGSVAFAFFDTCYSGALDQFNAQFASVFDQLTVRATALASSSSANKAYGFEFTKGLVSWWNSKRDNKLSCTSAVELGKELKLKNQTPKVVLSDDDLCLNSIGPNSAILILLPEHSPGGTVSIVVDDTNEVLGPIPITAYSRKPLVIASPRRRGHVEFYGLDGEKKWGGEDTRVDLISKPYAVIDLGSHTNPYDPSISPAQGTNVGMKSSLQLQ
jgi:hypothetical protein